MNTEQNMEERIWEYLDGISSDKERSVIDKLIDSNNEWRAKYAELLEIKQLMQATELEEPSMRFTKNVMDEIAKFHIAPATKNYINKNVIRGLAIFFLTLIAGFVVYGFGQVDWSTGSDSKLPINFNSINYNSIDYSRIFNNAWVNVFLMINLIVALFFLDRFLANKRKNFQQES